MHSRWNARHTVLPAIAIITLVVSSLIGIGGAQRTRKLESRVLRDYAELAAWNFAYRGSTLLATLGSVDSSRTAQVLSAMFAARPALLPETMTGISDNIDLAQITIVEARGRVVFTSPRPYRSPFSATVDFGSRGSALLTLALSPAAARGLLGGSVPGRGALLQTVMSALALLLAIAIAFTLRRAQRLARLRADFAAAVTHELRTPLTQILLNAETLELERERSVRERREFTGAIVREARRLVQLIDNVLHFSRAERRMLRVHPRRERIDELVRAMVRNRSSSGTPLDVSAEQPVWAMADADALSLVIGNVIDNALQHGGGTPVNVHVVSGAHSANIVVTDGGPGIAERDRERVLKPFVRLSDARERHPSGSGIGLAVVDEAVRAMGGTLTLADAEPRGLRVHIALPLAEEAA